MDFLLVHGSTQSPRGYDRLAAELTRRVHRAVAVDLPIDHPQWTSGDYAGYVARQAAGVTEPVLVVHSAAGALAAAVAAAVGARHVAWPAAVLPDVGRNVMDEVRADTGMFAAEWRTWSAGCRQRTAR
jgi:pimeloyl-ACP methyl ester carboxylesterase